MAATKRLHGMEGVLYLRTWKSALGNVFDDGEHAVRQGSGQQRVGKKSRREEEPEPGNARCPLSTATWKREESWMAAKVCATPRDGTEPVFVSAISCPARLRRPITHARCFTSTNQRSRRACSPLSLLHTNNKTRTGIRTVQTAYYPSALFRYNHRPSRCSSTLARCLSRSRNSVTGLGPVISASRSIPGRAHTQLSCTVKRAIYATSSTTMAQNPSIAMALASPTPSVNIPKLRDAADTSGTANYERKATMALLTPPNSISPELAAHPVHEGATSPPPMDIEHEMEDDNTVQSGGMPLSRGALSDLNGAQTITPSMLAKHHLPGIMLGNGPRPIRYVMGELTQTVPGFSRIPPAKARRIVVAALENRQGGGLDGNVEFCKTGWGRWDAHYKGSSRDSGIGSLNDGRLSPPRSERSYAVSYSDSAINMPGQHMPAKYRDQHSGGSWTASSIREEDEFDMDMDPVEDDLADKMSMDGDSDDSSDMDDETDDEDWAAVGIDALRKASLPTSNVTRQSYRAASQPYHGQWASKLATRRPSTNYQPSHSTSVPLGNNFPGMQTPEEKAAIAALMSMGSM